MNEVVQAAGGARDRLTSPQSKRAYAKALAEFLDGVEHQGQHRQFLEGPRHGI